MVLHPAEAVGERPQQLRLSHMFVSAFGSVLAGAIHRKERAGRLGFGGGGLEIGDVAFDLHILNRSVER